MRGTKSITHGSSTDPRITPACAGNRYTHRGLLDIVGITPACAGNSDSFRHFPLNGKDHPRVCGEQSHIAKMQKILAGSPPRVRGTVLDNGRIGYKERITPACAGNSAAWRGCRASYTDHPRVCGEQVGALQHGRGGAGSPPRVRGTDSLHLLHHLLPRITPACAGNSASGPGRSSHPQDHPRVCGEQAGAMMR